ncbi:MAG: Hpt domain-containing protein, partial [Lachnospiraceae bacterium]|nr:Hpt domain-containing protein [Lachnospiraceae bacterium]
MDVSQYLDIFVEETDEHIQTLSDNIMILENEPENKDTINEIFRAAHSLKGMAGTMGFKKMQTLTHDMENLFSEVRNDTIKVNSTLVDIMFDCLDAIEGYLNSVKETSDEGSEDNAALIQRINDFVASGGGDAAGGDSAPAESAPAEAAPAAAADAAGAEAAEQYKHLTIDDEGKGKLKEAADSGLNLFGFTVHISHECLLKAARAFLAFKAMEDFGEIVVYDPNSQDIEDEKFEFTFNTVISSNTDDLDAIKEAVQAVSEIESVEAGKVTWDMYDEKKEEAPAPQAAPSPAPAPAPQAAAAPAPAPAPKAEAAPSKASAKQAAANKKAANKPVTSRTVRVDIEKLDALMNQVSELIIAKNSIVSITSTADTKSDSGAGSQFLHEQVEYLERVATSLHESVMKVRMVPIESTVNKFPRMIRDLSRKLNKPMELVMTGEETELDRTVVD